MRVHLVLFVAAGAACRRDSPAANPEFNDAIHQCFVGFRAPAVELAFALRALEAETAALDLESNDVLDRSVLPEPLTEADVASLDHPDRDVTAALPIAVATHSAFTPDDAVQIQLLTDQTPVEPYSPDYFERSFVEGEDCFPEHTCEWLLTTNDLVKKNILMEVPYEFQKDFRWIDLGLPDPADVPAGEDPVNDGAERWAMVAQSWQSESFVGDGGDTTLAQSFTVEVWIPAEAGMTRLQALWSETILDGLDVSDDTITATARGGIDRNFGAQEDWLEANAR